MLALRVMWGGRTLAGARHEDQEFQPIAVVEVELSAAVPAISPVGGDGVRYGGARLIVRLHTKTIGVVNIDFGDGALSSRECALAIWSALGSKINAHLRADLLPEVVGIDHEGFGQARSPPCVHRREVVLRDPTPVSVIICTRNRADRLTRTLASFAAMEYPDYELLVIDGSQSEETRGIVRRQFPNVRYLHVGDHGRSFALNRGIGAATGSIIAFTDDDVRADQYWLSELVAGFSDRQVACVTGVAFPMELRTQAQVWFEESGGFTHGLEPRTIGLSPPPEPGSLLPFATGKIGAGVSMAWRRDVLLEVKGFDVALDTLTPVWPLHAGRGSSGEDLAAFFDALTRGYRVVFEPSAIVFHEHRRTHDELARQLYWHGLGLSAYLFRSLLVRPELIPAFLRLVPRGLAYGFGKSSIRNDKKSAGFPATLTRAEWRGIAHGPFAYVRGLPRARQIRETLAAGAGP